MVLRESIARITFFGVKVFADGGRDRIGFADTGGEMADALESRERRNALKVMMVERR